MSNYQTFVDAKGVIRRHPDWDDGQVAEDLGVKPADRAAMAAIAEARKDVAAGDTVSPHISRDPGGGTGRP